MAELTYEDFSFVEYEDRVRFIFLKFFYFDVSSEALHAIAPFSVAKHTLTFDCDEKRAERKIQPILSKGFNELRNIKHNKRTLYVHKNSGIPLIGHMAFGIVDRGTNIIELKPITGCNIKCVYCSVDEDRRGVDVIVEKDYMVEETRKLIEYKECEEVELFIGCNGEPFLYAPLVELIRDLSAIPQVKFISMVTNATMLTEPLADALVKAGLTRFNVSINAHDAKKAREIAAAPYSIHHVFSICHYIDEKWRDDVELVITPTWIPGVNDAEMPPLIEHLKKIIKNPIIGIQNFLNYKNGRNPIKGKSWDEFTAYLKQLEKDHNIKLVFDFKKDFKVLQTKKLPRICNKGEVIDIDFVSIGRLPNEKLGVYQGYVVSVIDDGFLKKHAKVKVVRTKHNIYVGVPV